MKTFFTICVSLIIGCAVGVMAAYDAANKKAEEKIKDELAEYRRAARAEENVPETANTTVNGVDDIEAKEEGEKTEMEKCEELAKEYRPSAKPYILEDMDDEWLYTHKYVDDFNEIEVVYDKSRGRAADEDGCEIEDIRGTLGFNNVNKLFTTYKNKKAIHIICERDGIIYIVHAGNLYEFLDEEEENDYDA